MEIGRAAAGAPAALQPIGDLCAPQGQAAPLAGPVVTSALIRILNRRSEAASASPRPTSQSSQARVADPQQAQVGVELALRLEQQGVGALPVGQTGDVLGEEALEVT